MTFISLLESHIFVNSTYNTWMLHYLFHFGGLTRCSMWAKEREREGERFCLNWTCTSYQSLLWLIACSKSNDISHTARMYIFWYLVIKIRLMQRGHTQTEKLNLRCALVDYPWFSQQNQSLRHDWFPQSRYILYYPICAQLIFNLISVNLKFTPNDKHLRVTLYWFFTTLFEFFFFFLLLLDFSKKEQREIGSSLNLAEVF